MSATMHLGDCQEIMRTFPDNHFDTVITDPPAGISFMNMAFDSDRGGRAQWIAWLTPIMAECLRVTKPGGSALVWSIPRTSHWTGTALEMAGWEVRDVITHLFGSGFPKSLDISKQLDKMAGAEREVIGMSPNSRFNQNKMYANGNGLRGHESYTGDPVTAPATDAARTWDGWGTALKPAAEFWWLCQKKLDGTYSENAAKWGVAGLAIDKGRIPANGSEPNARTAKTKAKEYNGNTYQPITRNGDGWQGESGRWPSNLLLDESAAAHLDQMSGELTSGARTGQTMQPGRNGIYGNFKGRAGYCESSTGGASRFFQIIESDEASRICSLCDMPLAQRHGIMNVTPEVHVQEDIPCNANNAEKNLSQNTENNDSAADHAPEPIQLDSAGKSESLRLFVSNAESSSTPTPETSGYSAPSNASLIAIVQNALSVSCAENLCEKCKMSIAQNLVAIGQNLEEPRSRRSWEHFISGIQNALGQRSDGATETIQSFAQKQWHAFERTITAMQIEDPAKSAEIQRLTSITMIIQSLWMCDTSAADAILPFTLRSAAVGGQGYESASRLIYCGKSSRRERNLGLEGMPERPIRPDGKRDWGSHDIFNTAGSGRNTDNKPAANHHPTCKPIKLMRYLCRLTSTPTGGIVLDPFAGSGSTGVAAIAEGRNFVGIELDADYFAIMERRIAHALAEQERAQMALPLEMMGK